MSRILKRISQIIEKEGVSIGAFERSIGSSKGVLSRAIANGTDINTKWLEAIVENYPEVSPGWLLSGEGEMQKTAHQKPEYEYVRSTKAIEKSIDLQYIPLYDLRASAGLATLFTGNENIVDKIKIPKLSNVDGAVFITGDSMYPLLKSGDIVIYKQVHNIDYLNYGDIYILSYQIDGDEHVVVKYVNVSEQTGFIKLVSYNSHYASLDIPLSAVRTIALVKASIRYNTMY